MSDRADAPRYSLRMLKKLSNRGEAFVHDLLAPAAARHKAEIYRKVRIGDVVDIDALGPGKLRSLGFTGHFDFVVTDADHNPQFAIEFDGGGHDPKNDHLKDEICRRADLALFRLDPGSSRLQIKQASFVAFLVDVWFYAQAFFRMRTEGAIPADEPFMMMGFLKPDAKNIFDSEFVYAFTARARLNRVLKTGDPFEHLNSASISMIGPDGQYAAFARHGDYVGRSRVSFKAVTWGSLEAFEAARELSEFCHALAYHDLCDEIELAREAPNAVRTMEAAREEIAELTAQGFRMVLGMGDTKPWFGG